MVKLRQQMVCKNYHLLLPIPQSEIDLNKDVELTQNLGYEN